MFALEIEFHDGVSSPETIFVRRNNAVVGTSEHAHVVIEGAGPSVGDFRIIRGLGREFRCQSVRRKSGSTPFLEGTYRDQAELKFGDISVRVTAIDIDLCLLPDEFPDRAALRVLRAACVSPSPVFPAVAVMGSSPLFVSFSPEVPLTIGRSRKCSVRLDSSDVSAEHARIGLDGEQVWIEDLGSTNSTLVSGEKISGRHALGGREVISIGSSFSLVVVQNPADVAQVTSSPVEVSRAEAEVSYPCILAANDIVRPKRFALVKEGSLKIGRDAACDIWANAPHISRHHLELRWEVDGRIFVTDRSSNGSYLWSDRLPKGQEVELPGGLCLLDLCSGIILAICRNTADERNFQRKAPLNPGNAPAERMDSALATGSFSSESGESGLSLEALVKETDISPKQKQSSGVFENLAKRAGNQAQITPFGASEENEHSSAAGQAIVERFATNAADLQENDIEELPSLQSDAFNEPLRGILDDEHEAGGDFDVARELGDDDVAVSSDESKSKFDFDDGDSQRSGNFLRIVLVLGGLSLLLFCVLLVGWMLSEALFYQ